MPSDRNRRFKPCRGISLARLLTHFALSVGTFAFAAAADTVVLTPIDAQAETQDGLNWTVSTSSDSLNASRFTGIPLERRAVLEFSLGAIPVGATIESAVLSYRIATFTGGSGTPSRIEFHGYSGNGSLAVADALVPFNLIGQSADITTLGSGSTSLNPAYVQSRLGGHLGIMMYQQTLGRQGAIYSADWFIASDRPQLTVTFSMGSVSTVAIAPLDGWAAREMGGPWMLGIGTSDLEVYRSPVFQREHRSIMEFPLRLPHRSSITIARLVFTATGRNFPPNPTVEFRGYAGDGVILGEDADRPFTLLGVSPPVTGLGTPFTAELSVPVVQSFLGVHSHLGAYGYQPTDESTVVIAGTGHAFSTSRPKLQLSYIPPACRADHNGVGGVTVQDIFDFLNDYFASRPAADFDLSGAVGVQDIFDYLHGYFVGCP